MKKLLKITLPLAGFLLLSAATPVSAAPVDAPHNETFEIQCGDCHSYSLWWQFSPASRKDHAYSGLATTDSSIVNAICSSCHDGATAPQKKAHNSSNLSENHGIWSTNCTDCHNPHNQDQLNWLGEAGLYLQTGTIGESLNYSQSGQTSFLYSISPGGSPYWQEPQTWHSKGLSDRGLLLVTDKESAAQTFAILQADESTITIKGTLPSSFAGKSFGLIYGQLIRSSVKTPAGPKDVHFFDPNIPFGSGKQGGFVSSADNNRSGLCQACHTNTRNWTRSGLTVDGQGNTISSENHYPDAPCTSCHLTAEGFKVDAGAAHPFLTMSPVCQFCHSPADQIISTIHQDNCSNCHTIPPALADPADKPLAADISRGPEGVGAACTTCHISTEYAHDTEVAHNNRPVDATCGNCHTSDTTNLGFPGNGHLQNANDLDMLHGGCLACHDYSGGVLQADDVESAIASGRGASGSVQYCADCHLNNAQNHQTDVAHDNRIIGGGCTACHTRPDGTALATAADIDTLHKNSCATCHAYAGSKLDPEKVKTAIQNGLVGLSQDCTSCHDGSHDSAMAHNNRTADDLTADCILCHGVLTGGALDQMKVDTLHLNDCGLCHNYSGTKLDPVRIAAAIDAGRSSGGSTPQNCQACHRADTSGQHHDTSAYQTDNCSLCHTGATAVLHDNRSLNNLNCGDCHAVSGPAAIDLLHGSCRTCHAYSGAIVAPDTVSAAILAGINGALIDCTACHGEGGHPTVATHNNRQLTGLNTDCAACHDVVSGGSIDQVKVDAIHNNDCILCHNYNGSKLDPTAVEAAITTGKSSGADTVVNCESCHGSGHDTNLVHDHRTAANLETDCTLCHGVFMGALLNQQLIDQVHNNDCNLCHFYTGMKLSPDNVNQAISSGQAGIDQNCLACHSGYAGQHHFTSSYANGLCSQCHTGSSAVFHDSRSAAGLACAACHDASSSDAIDLLHGGCQTCHGYSGTVLDSAVVNSAIAAGTNGTLIDCVSCHELTGHPTELAHNNRTIDALNVDCSNCHDILSSGSIDQEKIDILHRSDCLVCHQYTGSKLEPADVSQTIALGKGDNGIPVNCENCHVTGHNSAIDHDYRVTTGLSTDCTACHQVTSQDEIDALHDDCIICHSSDKDMISAAIEDGMNGILIHCGNCHNGSTNGALTHGTSLKEAAVYHNHLQAVSACTTCHNISGTFTDIYALHQHDCTKCHSSSRFEVQNSIFTGKNGTDVYCTHCHGNDHHDSAQAQTGNCTWCHEDPRLAVWSGAPTGQLACRECHANSSGYIQTGSGAPAHNHGPVQDYGACFACHSPTPYHAKPSNPDCNGNNPGQGSFNIFKREFGGRRDSRRSSGWGDEGSSSCRDNEGRYDSAGIHFDCAAISSSDSRVYDQSLLRSQGRMVPIFESAENCPSDWWSNDSSGGGGYGGW